MFRNQKRMLYYWLRGFHTLEYIYYKAIWWLQQPTQNITVKFQLLNLLYKNIWNTYISVASDTKKSFIQVRGSATVVSTIMENMQNFQKLIIYSEMKNEYYIIDYEGIGH